MAHRVCTHCEREIPEGYCAVGSGWAKGPEVEGMCMTCISPYFCARCGGCYPDNLLTDPTDEVEMVPEHEPTGMPGDAFILKVPSREPRRLCIDCLLIVSRQRSQAAA